MTEEPPSPGATVTVRVEDPGWPSLLRDPEPLVERAALAALTSVGHADAAEISVVLVDDRFIRELNRRYRGQDKATNVLSFGDLDSGIELDGTEPWLLGDVVLARQTIEAEATAQAKPLADHLAHLVVHGVLHLLGYDHECDAAATEMERHEVAALACLGIADPYQARPLAAAARAP